MQHHYSILGYRFFKSSGSECGEANSQRGTHRDTTRDGLSLAREPCFKTESRTRVVWSRSLPSVSSLTGCAREVQSYTHKLWVEWDHPHRMEVRWPAQENGLVAQAHEFLDHNSVCIVTDNRDLVGDSLDTTPSLAHWPVVAAWWRERSKYVGPNAERTTVFSFL